MDLMVVILAIIFHELCPMAIQVLIQVIEDS
jgi:hypothetical protein